MSAEPISVPEAAEAGLIEAARAFERGAEREAAALWEGAIPLVRANWPAPLAEAICGSLDLVARWVSGAVTAESGEGALRAWDALAAWLSQIEMPLAGGRSTPAHFRKHRRDPAVYRSVALSDHLRLAGAGRAVVLNNHALALAALGRGADQAGALLREAAALRREAFGWREDGLLAMLGNLAVLEPSLEAAAQQAKAGEPVPVGADRFLALARGQSDLRRRLLAAAELVPILRQPAG